MYFTSDTCTHLNEVIDQREGTTICTDCGLVLSSVYLTDRNLEYFVNETNIVNEYILEILERLNMPRIFVHDVVRNLENVYFKERKSLSLVTYVIYKTLNELNCGVGIREISSVSGFSDKEIYNQQDSNETIILDPLIPVEKFCQLLGLPKGSHSVIKENLGFNKTGHNPTTIIAAHIYKYCLKNNIKVSIETIARTTSISCISIKRYLKKIENES